LSPLVVHVWPPGEEVAVYWVIALPPLFEGAVQETRAAAIPAVAVAPVGLSGTVGPGVTLLEGPEGTPVPEVLVAVTVKV
jgi:hypothetical protein